MGGVSGHAGLFSTADDLALFAQAFLNRGELNKVSILKPETVEQMTSPQSPPGKTPRGLGWDLGPSFVSDSNEAAQTAAYGHLGYTGTALWIDPLAKTYVIVLTNRVHPYGRGDVQALRADIKELVSKALAPLPFESIATSGLPFGELTEKSKEYPEQRGVLTGIDVLEAGGFSALSGQRVGLITNHTGIDSRGRRTIDLLKDAPGVTLAAIFSPEH
jgi:hypothetical protein